MEQVPDKILQDQNLPEAVEPDLLNIYQNILLLNGNEVEILRKEGYTTPLNLETMSDNSLKEIAASELFRAAKIDRLKAFRTWLREQDAKYTQGELEQLNIYDVSSEILTGIMIRGSMHDEDDKKESRVKISAVEPGTFDGSDENFEKFKQSLCLSWSSRTYLYYQAQEVCQEISTRI
jgi:hypothetical protein